MRRYFVGTVCILMIKYHFRRVPIIFWWVHSSINCSNSRILFFDLMGIADGIILEGWNIFYTRAVRINSLLIKALFMNLDGFTIESCWTRILSLRLCCYVRNIGSSKIIGFMLMLLVPSIVIQPWVIHIITILHYELKKIKLMFLRRVVISLSWLEF